MRYLSSLFVLAIVALSGIVFALPKRALEGKKFAVVVGVSGYLSPSEPGKGGQSSLRFAHKDAERMSAKLKSLGWETTLLQSLPAATASGATKDKILNALRALKTNPEDSVLFYFSGHGVQLDKQDCLLPADVTFSNLSKTDTPAWKVDRETVISSRELTDVFAKMAASKRLMIVDACRFEPAGFKGGDDGSVNQAKLGEVVKYREAGSVSFGVMYSCLAGEKSWEGNDGGVFTNGLLSALDSGRVTDADGTIALTALNARTREKVAEHVKAKPEQKMSPNLMLQEEEPIILGVLKTTTGGSAVVVPTRARFGVEGAPNGANLTVDGVLQSTLAYEVEVGAGGKKTVVAVISAPGYVSATYQVALQAGAYTPLKVVLEKAPSAGNQPGSNLTYEQLIRQQEETAAAYKRGRDIYLGENGASKDYDQAFSILKSSADAGNAEACLLVAECCEKGRGTEKDAGSANRYKSLAKERFGVLGDGGDASSRARYETLFGKDAKVAGWIRERAEGGDPKAMYEVAIALGKSKESRDWLRRGANAGDVSCMLAMSTLYLTGEFFEPNAMEAEKWLNLALDKGTNDAVPESLSQFLKGLTSFRDFEGGRNLASPLIESLSSNKALDRPENSRISQGIRERIPYRYALGQTLTGNNSSVSSLTFSKDGSTLASGFVYNLSDPDDIGVRLWRVSNGSLIRTVTGKTYGVSSVALSPDGSTLAGGCTDNSVRLWRVSDGSLLRTLSKHKDTVHSVAFAPDGSTVASGSGDSTVRLWRVSDGSLLRTFAGHNGKVNFVAYSPDGSTLASGSKDETIRLWRILDGSLLRTLPGSDWIYSVVFSPDGSTLASGSWNGSIRLWRVSDGSILHTLTVHTGSVNTIVFSPDGSTLFSASDDNTIRIWHVHDGFLLGTLTGHTSNVQSVAISPDGSTLASGSWDKTIKLWRIPKK